jgi:hypothetical protein
MTLGLKLSKLNKDVETAPLEDLLFHSNYSMFKYHSDNIRTMTINPGDSTKIVSFAHGLSYVPAFIAYASFTSGIYPLPNRKVTLTGIDENFYTYADSTNINIGWKSALKLNSSNYSCYFNYSDITGANNAFVGNIQGSSARSSMTFYLNGGQDLLQGDTIISATINFKIDQRGPGNGDVKIRTYGIDVDDCGFVYDEWGLSKTTAYKDQNVAAGAGSYFGIDVKDIVREIINRPGWVDSSILGFYIEDNSSPYEANIWDYSESSYLEIITSGNLTYNFRVIVFKDKIHS